MTVKASAIIVAAGSGARLPGGAPKPYLELGGEPVLFWSVAAFAACGAVSEIVVGAAAEWLEKAGGIAQKAAREKPVKVIQGGSMRQETVSNCLLAVSGAEIVAIHDAARPFIEPGIIEAAIAAAAKNGAATAAISPADTIKLIGGMNGKPENLPRERLQMIQTPQTFRLGLIREAHKKAAEDGFTGTDDTALVERLGTPAVMVEGSAFNFKVTTPRDYEMAKALVAAGVVKMAGR